MSIFARQSICIKNHHTIRLMTNQVQDKTNQVQDKTNQVQDNKRVIAPVTIVGWVTIGLILAFAYVVYQGSESIGTIQKDIAALNAFADSTLRDSTAFMQPSDVKIMVGESAREVFDTYVSTQGNLLAIVAVLITVIVIVIPLILNNNFRNTNEEWFRKKVEDAEKNMNDELQDGLKQLEGQSSAGVKAIEDKVNKQKNDIDVHQKTIEEQARTVERQAEEIKKLKENIEKFTKDYKLEVEHGESLKQVEKKKGRNEKIEYLQEEIRKNKENYPASGFYELGKLYFEEEDYGKSIANLKVAIDRNPDLVEAYQVLAEAYLKVRQLEEAWKNIEVALGIKETSSLIETRCKVFIELGLFENAKKDADSAAKLALKEGDAVRLSNMESQLRRIGEELQKRRDNNSDEVVQVADTVFRMKKVEGGAFTMGASQGDSDAFEDEKPAHRVLLNSYYIGETVVTQALWKAVMETNIRHQRDKISLQMSLHGEGDEYPMYYVSWYECQEFIKKLNLKTGKNFRLPTEAEWEFAARGGNQRNRCKYAGSDSIGEVAWYWENSGDKKLSGTWDWDEMKKNNCKAHPVKGKKPNELGIYDMSGNVWEWCQDLFGSYTGSEQVDPQGPSGGSNRVLRGGSWGSYARYCRVSDRYYSLPDRRRIHYGFRLCLPQKTSLERP